MPGYHQILRVMMTAPQVAAAEEGGGGGTVAEVTELNFGDCTGSTLGMEEMGAEGRAFLISTATERYAVWFMVDDEIQPTVPGATAYVPVVISSGASGADAAQAVRDALASLFAVSAPDLGMEHVVTVTDLELGPRVDAADFSSNGMVITVLTQGA